jgi:hypothetical protein
MSEQLTRKKPHGHDHGGRSQYASSVVKQELARIAQQTIQSSAGLGGSDAVASPLSPENVVGAVLGERAGKEPLSKDDKRRSVHDWTIVTPGS